MNDDLYKEIIQESPAGYAYHKIICDENDRPFDFEFIDMNPAFESFTGFKRQEMIGRRLTEIFPKIFEHRIEWIKIYGEIAIHGGKKEIEIYCEKLKTWYRIKIYSPQKYYFITYSIDISREVSQSKELKDLQEKVSESEALFELLIENLPFSLSIVTVDGTLLYINSKGIELFELDGEEFGTKEALSLWIDPEQRKHLLKTVEEKGMVKDFEMHMRTRKGKILWAMGSGMMVRYRNQTCILTTQHDITERKMIEKALRKSEEEYRLLFENAVETIFVVQDGHIKICNRMAEVLTGYTREEIDQLGFNEFIHPEDREAVVNKHIRRLKGEAVEPIYVFKLLRKDKLTRWVEMNSIKINWNGKAATLNFLVDITERKITENALKDSEEKYRFLTEYASDVIWILNIPKIKFTYISPSIFTLRGLTVEEAMEEAVEDSVTPESFVLINNAIARDIEEFKKNPDSPVTYMLEIQQICKNGDIIWVEVSTKFRYNPEGEIEAVGVSRNIEERKRSEREVLYLSYHDQLTGLYNRRFYEEELRRLYTERNLPVTLVMADVNGLKLTNDAFGHLAGDELLKNFAGILKKEARGDDIIARIGGDEFMILLPKTDAVQAEKIVDRIKASIAKEKVNRTILSVSFGWVTKNDLKEDFEKIYMQAEDNMYRKKLLESTSMKSETIKRITQSLYEKNAVEQPHCERVSKLCKEIGEAMGLGSDILNELSLLGLLHDIGKIGVEEEILNKPQKLDQSEWVDVRRHPEIGYQILKSVSEFSHIAEFVLSHHERLDGNGYPRNLKGSEIPLQARILSIAGAYDVMTNSCPYKVALAKEEAIRELEANADTQFDGNIVRIFIEKVLGEKGHGR